MKEYRHSNRTSAKASRHRAGVFTLFVCLLLSSACDKESYEPETQPARTLLFYMGGDNNLSAQVNAKIEQIISAPLSPHCRVLIYTDTKDNPPQLLEVLAHNGNNRLEVRKEYDESNSADADVFASLLREVRENHPAPSYGLVLFSHATGWLPEGAYKNPAAYSNETSLRSVVQDGSYEMEIPAFAAAIPTGMFDFIVFEACYMASVEVAYELKDKTRYIVASSAEIVSPGFSRCYAQALPCLYREQPDLTGFCRVVETDYATRPGDYASLTLSLINTGKLETLAAAVREYGLPTTDATTGVQAFDRGGGRLFFDLNDSYATRTKGESDGGAALKEAIDRCVEWKTATSAFMPTYGGFEVQSHCGLTTYITQESYAALNEAYQTLAWYEAASRNVNNKRKRQ